jgi:hypothetical protein
MKKRVKFYTATDGLIWDKKVHVDWHCVPLQGITVAIDGDVIMKHAKLKRVKGWNIFWWGMDAVFVREVGV